MFYHFYKTFQTKRCHVYHLRSLCVLTVVRSSPVDVNLFTRCYRRAEVPVRLVVQRLLLDEPQRTVHEGRRRLAVLLSRQVHLVASVRRRRPSAGRLLAAPRRDVDSTALPVTGHSPRCWQHRTAGDWVHTARCWLNYTIIAYSVGMSRC